MVSSLLLSERAIDQNMDLTLAIRWIKPHTKFGDTKIHDGITWSSYTQYNCSINVLSHKFNKEQDEISDISRFFGLIIVFSPIFRYYFFHTPWYLQVFKVVRHPV